MPASTEQKVDFLLKKIGYSASKTGGVEGSSGTVDGTKKKPSEEAIPSPLVVPSTSVWADSSLITATPPGSDTFPIKVYATASAYRLTVDNSVSESRSFIARSTYGNASSSIDGDWIDSQFGADYAVRVFKGDPNSGGVELAQAGATGNDTWFFDYSSGILNFTGTDNHSSVGVTDTNIYILGYRYIGGKGAKPPSGIGTFSSLNVTGIATFHKDVEFIGAGDAGIKSTFWDQSASSLKFLDGVKAEFGDLQDLKIYHDSATDQSVIKSDSKIISIMSGDTVEIEDQNGINIAQFKKSGGSLLYHDGGDKKFETLQRGVGIGGSIHIDNDLYVTGISTLNGAVSIGNSLSFGDNEFIYMGDGAPLEIGHYGGDGHSQIKHDSATEDLVLSADRLRIINRAENKNLANFTEGSHVRLYHDGNQRFTTTGYGVSVSALESIGISTFHNDVHLLDNDKIVLGVGKTEFQVYHDGATSIIKSGEGNLNLQTVSGEVILSDSSGVVGVSYKKDDRVLINHAGSTRFVTTGYGVSVSALESIGISTFHKDVEFVGTGGAGITSAYWDQSDSSLKFLDGVKAKFGDHNDLSIYHTNASGGYSVISESGTGQLVIGGNLIEFKNEALNTTYASIDQTGIDVTGHTETDTLKVSGISTLGNIGISTGLISGPAITYIDPAAVGDNTGLLVVKGNLQVDGTQTTVNSSTMTVTDKNIEIAKGAANDAAADGAGITIDSGDGDKTWNWVDANASWSSSEHIRIPTDKVYGFSGDGDTYISRKRANTIAFTLGGNERLIVNPGGATSISAGNPTLDLQSTSSAFGDVAKIRAFHGGGAMRELGSIVFDPVNAASSDIIFNTRDSNTVSEIVRFKKDGKVGINSTSPATTLDVRGTLQVSGISTFNGNVNIPDSTASSPALRLGSDADFKIHHDGSDAYLSNATGQIAIKTPDNSVAISITDANTVFGDTAKFNSSVLVSEDITHIGDTNTKITFPSAGDIITANTGGTERFRINADGNTKITGGLSVTGITTVATLNVGVSGQTLVGINTILDEDTMASNSATALATQQSIKAYVDTQVTSQDLDFQADTGGALSVDLDSETLHVLGTANEIETSGSSSGIGNTITIGLPDNVTIANDLTVASHAGIGSLSVTGISTFNGDVTVDADLTANNLTVRDNGTGNPTVMIKSDDQNVNSLIIKNDTYSNNNSVGFKFAQQNNGEFIFSNRGASEYLQTKFRGHNGSSAVDILTFNKDNNVIVDSALKVAGISTFNDDVTFVGAASSNATWDKDVNSLKFDDHVKAQFGDDQDLSIYHAPNNSFIKNTTGQLALLSPQWGVQGTGSEGYNIYCVAGAQIQLYYAGDKKLETLERGVGIGGSIHIDNDVNVAGISTFNNDVEFVGQTAGITSAFWDQSAGKLIFKNNVKAEYGDSSNLSIYASGTDKYIKGSTSGELVIRDDAITMQAVSTTDTYFDAVHGGSVSLYWDNSKKFETLQKGVGIGGSIHIDNDAYVTGISTFNNDTTFVGAGSSNTTWDKDANSLKFDDHVKAQFGDGQDLSIYWNGSRAKINSSGSNLDIESDYTALKNRDNNREYITCTNGDSVDLFWSGASNGKRFETTQGGTLTTGIATATGVINSETDVQINGVSVQTTALNDAVAMAIALG